LREKETEEQEEGFMMVIRQKIVEKEKKTRRLSRFCRRLLTQTSIPASALAGAGFLSPFHIGVVQALQEKGIITSHTKVRALQTFLSSSITLIHTHSNHYTHVCSWQAPRAVLSWPGRRSVAFLQQIKWWRTKKWLARVERRAFWERSEECYIRAWRPACL